MSAPTALEELPPDERIAALTPLLATADEAGRAELHGLLAEAFIERYGADPDPGHVDAAIDLLVSALAALPDGPEALWWRHNLALSYQERADRTGSLADYDRSIEELEFLSRALDPSLDERDLTVAMLIDSWWDRAQAVGRESGHTLDDAQRTAAIIGVLAVDIRDPHLAAYGRLMHGLAKFAIHDESDDRSDLDVGIEILAQALDVLEPDTPRYVLASARLVFAYRQCFRLDDDPVALSRAIDAGRRADVAPEPDDPFLPLLHDFLAQSYQDRWDLTDDLEDLESAVGYWRQVLAVAPDAHSRAQCGRLLRERAERRDRADDAQEAIELLEEAATQDDEAFFELARAHQARWRLAGTVDSLPRAAECLDRVLAADPALADNDLLIVHRERLLVTNSLIEEQEKSSPGEPPPAELVMRAQAAEAEAVFERTLATGDHDLRAMLATLIALGTMVGRRSSAESLDTGRVTELLDFGRTAQDLPPGWQRIIDGSDALVQYTIDARHGGSDRDGGLEPLLKAMGGPPGESTLDGIGWQLMPLVLGARAVRTGDRRQLRAAVEQLLGSADPDALLLGRIMDLMDRGQRDPAGITDEVRRLAAEVRENPPSYNARLSVVPLLAMLESLFDSQQGSGQVDRTPIPPGDLDAASVAVQAIVRPLGAAMLRHDVRGLRECAARVGEIMAEIPTRHTLRLIALGFGTMAELEVARLVVGDRAAARRAAAWYAELATLLTGPSHPLWARVALGHGEALRLAGDPGGTQSRGWGMSALRGFVWQVLLQAGTDDATVVAATASAAAMTVAGWCREDGADDDLVAALDAGRGLVLHAATTSRTIADQLADAGRDDLAEQWRESAGLGRDAFSGGLLGELSASGPQVPDDLRARVLRVIGADDPVHGGTFTPVRTTEIHRALAEVGADALIYLVPTTESRSGAAVIVPVAGPVVTLALPDLVSGPQSVAGRLAAAGATRDADVLEPPSADAGPSIDDVCRWAWSAAVGAVLRHTERWRLHRPVRLVLIPMGLLATVPWHAAFREDARGRHYAVRQAVFSYTVSARTLCETARFPARAIRSALVVGDPHGDLPFAGLEARAIGRAFYPDGTYLGRPAGTGTPEQVLDWIERAAPGPSLLHLACHGRADPVRPADAHLVLAGGTLTARRLLEASRTAELIIERVFLAACTTGVTGTDYDEAFSLSTAFLAAGARTVFGSLWAVPDAETSLLMFLVHHHLNVTGCAPADALHRAQQWMLDPARQPPPGMPPELAGHCAGERAADPVSWAAFTHLGR